MKKNILLAFVLLVCLAAAVSLVLARQPLPEEENKTLFISELCAKNESVIADNDGKYRDYIELYNSGEDLDLTGCYFTDGSAVTAPLSRIVLRSGEYRLFFLGDAAGLRLSASGGEALWLSDGSGNILAQATTVSMAADQVMVLGAQGYTLSNSPSPGFPNNATGIEAFRKGKPSENLSVQLSEVLVQNLSSLADENGAFTDVLELYNPTDSAVALGSWWLSDDKENRFSYRLPDISLRSGECLLIYCDNENYISAEGNIHANFALSFGETLCLTDPEGRYSVLDITYPGEDVSMSLVDGVYTATAVTLGYPNTGEN